MQKQFLEGTAEIQQRRRYFPTFIFAHSIVYRQVRKRLQ
jgi:hypothetical protein